MSEVSPKQAELYEATDAAEHVRYEGGKTYPKTFLAHLQDDNHPLLLEFINSQEKGVLKQMDTELDNWERIVSIRELEAQKPVILDMIRDNGFDPSNAKVEFVGNSVEITLPCPGKDLLVRSSVSDKSQDEWTLEGAAYTPGYAPYGTSWLINGDWGTLEEVLEDSSWIRNSLARVESGELKSDNLEPFRIGIDSLTFDGHLMHVPGQNTFETEHPDRLAKRINERFRMLTGKEAPAVAVAPMPAVAPAATLASTGGQVPATPEAPASTIVAPDVETVAAPESPKSAAEKPVYTAADIKNEGDFVNKRMHDDGWKNYVVSPETVGDDTEGTIVAKLPTDVNDPDYKYSRIHHFLGKDESVQKIADFSNLDVTVNGNSVEWRATTEYQDGTWVNPDTGKRVAVMNGTTIKWKPKALVAEAAVPLPQPVPEAPAPGPEAEPNSEVTVHQLATALFDVRTDDAVIARENELARKAGVKEKKAWFKAGKEDAQAEKGVHEANIVRLTGERDAALALLKANEATENYALAMKDEPKEALVALGLSEVNPTVVTQVTPPAGGELITDADIGDPAKDSSEQVSG